MIGISGPSMSISALSTPQPASAAITCSTVETPTPAPFDSTVHSLVSETASKRAGIIWSRSLTSTRQNQTPAPGGAGRIAMRAGLPPCRPTPVNDMDLLRVACMTDCPDFFLFCL